MARSVFSCMRRRNNVLLVGRTATGANVTGRSKHTVSILNENPRSDPDALFHLGLSSDMDLKEMFGDVKFFCTGGSAKRIKLFAEKLADALPGYVPFGSSPVPIGSTDRYEMYKVGPVLMVNHGMGIPSTSILLHEVSKLLAHAQAEDPVFIRLGTSGGIGVEPGSVVLSTEGVNGLLKSEYTLPVLGKLVTRPTNLDESVRNDIANAQKGTEQEDWIMTGKTMATDCFYEGQGRLDGAICEYEENDKMTFLKEAYDCGVRNFEMESTVFAAFTQKLNIRAAVCCVTLLDRMHGDQHPHTHEQLEAWDERPGDVIVRYIQKSLGVL
jgi:uridine phosphorylase